MYRIKAFFLTTVFFLCAEFLMAQPTDPNQDPDNPVPLTGLGYLLAAGGIFGARKIYQNMKKK